MKLTSEEHSDFRKTLHSLTLNYSNHLITNLKLTSLNGKNFLNIHQRSVGLNTEHVELHSTFYMG